MRALLICVGSRGDAEPFCSLADRLLAAGHEVEMFIQPELQSLVPSGDAVTLHLLPFTQMDFYKYVGTPSHGADHENPRVKFVGIVTDIIAALVLPCWSNVLKVAKTCQVLVTSALARSLIFAISQKTNIPVCLVHLQPLVPTMAFPHYSQTDSFIAALTKTSDSELFEADVSKRNLESYWELEKFQHDFLSERLDDIYGHMNLPPLAFSELRVILSGSHSRTFIVNSFYSPELLPTVPDGGPNLHHVGPLADAYIPKTFVAESTAWPDQDLVEFLDEHRPVCVGYGSMPCGKVEILLQALKELNRKAILVGDAIKIFSEKENDLTLWAQSNVRHVSSLPYAWLLPKCEMMLCHGGAGVVHSTIRAGIPVVISPLMGDQFFFARLCQARGIGSQAGTSLPSVTKDELVMAVKEAEKCIPAAREFGTRVRELDLGVDKMVRLLQSVVGTNN